MNYLIYSTLEIAQSANDLINLMIQFDVIDEVTNNWAAPIAVEGGYAIPEPIPYISRVVHHQIPELSKTDQIIALTKNVP